MVSKKFRIFAPSNNKKKKKNMWFVIFICTCVAIMVVDVINDPKFKEKIKNVEE